jgi:hypothetical protein
MPHKRWPAEVHFLSIEVNIDSYNYSVVTFFETPQIAEFFSDWKTDPLLSKAFALAMEWVVTVARS